MQTGPYKVSLCSIAHPEAKLNTRCSHVCLLTILVCYRRVELLIICTLLRWAQPASNRRRGCLGYIKGPCDPEFGQGLFVRCRMLHGLRWYPRWVSACLSDRPLPFPGAATGAVQQNQKRTSEGVCVRVRNMRSHDQDSPLQPFSSYHMYATSAAQRALSLCVRAFALSSGKEQIILGSSKQGAR